MNATFLTLRKPVGFPVGCSLQTSSDDLFSIIVWDPIYGVLASGLNMCSNLHIQPVGITAV